MTNSIPCNRFLTGFEYRSLAGPSPPVQGPVNIGGMQYLPLTEAKDANLIRAPGRQAAAGG